MARNLATTLKMRKRGSAFDAFDRLPPVLRCWLARAALPWSPQSVLRIWRRVIREENGDVGLALARLDLAERRMLAQDSVRIWGECYPAVLVANAAPCANARLPASGGAR